MTGTPIVRKRIAVKISEKHIQGYLFIFEQINQGLWRQLYWQISGQLAGQLKDQLWVELQNLGGVEDES